MATCEKCGTSFDPAAAPREVTTTRILCAPCAAARAAEKARSKGASSVVSSSAPAPKTASAPITAAAQVPAMVPPSRPAPSAPPAREAAVKRPELKHAEPAQAEPKRAEPRRAEAPPPAKVPPPKPAAAGRKPAQHAHLSELDRAELARKKNRAVIIGYVVALVLSIVAGVIVWQVVQKHRHDRKVLDDHQKEVDDFYARFSAMDINNEANALAAAKYGEEHRALWENDDKIGVDSLSRLAKANTNAKLFHERDELDQQIAKIEHDFADPSKLTPDAVISARRLLDDLEPRAGGAAEMVARIGKLRSSVDTIYADSLLEDARTAVAAGPTRETLQKFLRADDEIRNLLDAAKKAKNQAMDEHFTKLYQTVVKESDEAVGKVFTKEEIDKAPWRDLLADKELSNWLAPAAKGFEWRLENGVLHVVGPDADANGIPILSIGDQEKWCDFVGEMEFTLVKGSCNLYFRLGLGSSATRAAIAPQVLSTQGDNPLVAGEPNKVNFSIVGSSYYFEIAGFKADDSAPMWHRVRKGALAFEFDPKTKTELRITKLRVKVLRAGG